jgi:hypothetical protein
LVPIANAQRHLVVTPELERQLRGEDSSQGFSALGAASVLRQYISGQSLSISQRKRSPKLFKTFNVDLERLENFDEVWVLCLRKPKPGWRFMGRFLEKDLLALFQVFHKDEIGNDYGTAAASLITAWQKYFGTQPPLRGTWIESYLTGSHYDVDEKTQTQP